MQPDAACRHGRARRVVAIDYVSDAAAAAEQRILEAIRHVQAQGYGRVEVCIQRGAIVYLHATTSAKLDP